MPFPLPPIWTQLKQSQWHIQCVFQTSGDFLPPGGHRQSSPFPYLWSFLQVGTRCLIHRIWGGCLPPAGQEGCRGRQCQCHKWLVSTGRTLKNKDSSIPSGCLISTLADLILASFHLTLGFKDLTLSAFVSSAEAFLQWRADFSA